MISATVVATVAAIVAPCIRIITGLSRRVVVYASHDHHRPVANWRTRSRTGLVTSSDEQQMSFRCLINRDYN